jgi:hypothetical protein
MTALGTAGLLALVIWMDAANVSAESAAWISAGLLVVLAISYLVVRVWRPEGIGGEQ